MAKGSSGQLMLSTGSVRKAFLNVNDKHMFAVGGKIRIVNTLEKAMKRTLMVFLAMSALASGAAMANADLAKAKNCMACHAVANKVVGPAYKDVATKYADQKDAEDKLVKKVVKGGSGAWGTVPMPANPQVTEAEARTLVKWILSQK